MTQQTVQSIKRQTDFGLPNHWVEDWLLYVLAQPASFLITDSDYQLTVDQQHAFDLGIKKMQSGLPLAYLIGKQAFWSLEFLVNEHTLIPRPDTEVIVEQVLAWINQSRLTSKNSLSKNNLNSLNQSPSNQPLSNSSPYCQLLDLGTGSGCIAISLAHELAIAYPKQWQVTAVDYSVEALAIAKQNAELNNTSNINFIQSDWFSSIPKDNKYQVIVSNPPYIDPSDSHLDKLMAEPLSALVADDRGLADIRKIVKLAVDHLIAGGLLAIEHGYDQGEAVRQLFTEAGFVTVHTVIDYGGNDRLTMGERNIVCPF